MRSAFSSSITALKHRDYRTYWLRQAISLVGSAMQSAALGWLVYAVIGSATLLGSLTVTQIFMLQALVLSILAFTGKATYHLILPLASLYGIAQAFDYPCRRLREPLWRGWAVTCFDTQRGWQGGP